MIPWPANTHAVPIAAAISIVAMAAVVVVMDWVPTALNRNIRGMTIRERLPSTLIHSTLGAAFAVGNLLATKMVIAAGAVWYTVVLFAAVRNWWLPYFAGRYWGEITPQIYADHYARNVRVLPRFKNNPVIPDLQHMLIHSATMAACLLSWWAFTLG